MANQDGDTPKGIKRPPGTVEEQRQRRAEALKNTFGMWKDRTDIPKTASSTKNRYAANGIELILEFQDA
jgi:hypothetical protein